ncbi:MAG: hypothetical protein WC640_03380 [Candidatus Paceibacterota bacterium]|jgi:hypothetical protein
MADTKLTPEIVALILRGLARRYAIEHFGLTGPEEFANRAGTIARVIEADPEAVHAVCSELMKEAVNQMTAKLPELAKPPSPPSDHPDGGNPAD